MAIEFTKNKKGISILEVVVAILIIAIGLVGVLSLVIQNIQAQYIDKNVLIASGLAQEGLELVRNIRDLNWLTPGNAWNQDIVGDGTYSIDFSGLNSKICAGGSNGGTDCVKNSDCNSNDCRPRSINMAVNSINEAGARLYVNGNGFYTHTATATPTNFYRLITVVDHPSDGYLDIKCTIRWTQGTQNHDYVAETYLYNWR